MRRGQYRTTREMSHVVSGGCACLGSAHSAKFCGRTLFFFFFSVLFFLRIRRPPRSTLDRSSAASDVYKRQYLLEMIHARP